MVFFVVLSDFMQFKGVPFQEMQQYDEVADVLPLIRNEATKDRELMDKVTQHRFIFFRSFFLFLSFVLPLS